MPGSATGTPLAVRCRIRVSDPQIVEFQVFSAGVSKNDPDSRSDAFGFPNRRGGP
jgi:hypothetical protein